MHTTQRFSRLALCCALLGASPAFADELFALDSGRIDRHQVAVSSVVHEGRQALRVIDIAPASIGDGDRLAVLPDIAFADGSIDLDVAGEVLPDAPENARGFVGIAFHVADDARRFEYFYIRPGNGRADDQVRRNHAVQYAAHPDFPWQRLRRESPGKYESYADVEPRRWQHVRIEVQGDKARVYVNRAAQPTLVVNGLKLASGSGRVGLWIGPGTLAHFAGLELSAPSR